jgi:hypothetical protein
VEGAGGHGEHRHVHQAGQAQGGEHVQLLEPVSLLYGSGCGQQAR